ncbi:MAG: hypothetical protein M3Q30_23900 [Actinomycetota bacterium]|nr:hypothetical protein [Actinomycetota bacterium]
MQALDRRSSTVKRLVAPVALGLSVAAIATVAVTRSSPSPQPKTGANAIRQTTTGPTAIEPASDLPFVLTLSPQTPTAGTTVRVGFAGDLSDAWVHGPDASLDRSFDGTWRTVWAMLNDAFSASPTSIASAPEATRITVPAIGYPLTKDSSFDLPTHLEPGPYRFCKGVARSHTSPAGYRGARICTPLTVL